MKKAEKAMLLEALRQLAADVTAIADVLEGNPPAKKTVDATKPPTTKGESESKTEEVPMETEPDEETSVEKETGPAFDQTLYSFKEARAILADKARLGFSSDIKNVLKNHGVNKLSEITDSAVLTEIVLEVEDVCHG